MKRTAFALAALMAFTAPFAGASAFAEAPRYQHQAQSNNDRNGRNDRGDRNDQRAGQRWDAQRDNGYTYNGRWNYGPPPASLNGRAGFQPGWQSWRAGERLPSYYRAHYRGVDYHREHLRAPPRGYHYVRDDRGDVLLVGIATGIIASVIFGR
jgi:Ni/Co efflux regulator RcnB